MEATQFIGLSKKGAQNLSEIKNLIFRLISVDGEPFFSMPEDSRTDRVCVVIENNKVVKATIQ